MNIKYLIWSIIAALALTLAGCTVGSGAFIDKRIERTKLLNHIYANTDEAKRLNDLVDKDITAELKRNVEAEMDKDCTAKEREKLAKYETNYVDKLKVINDKKDRAAVPKAMSDSYKKEGKEEFKVNVKCEGAIKKLTQPLDMHRAPAIP